MEKNSEESLIKPSFLYAFWLELQKTHYIHKARSSENTKRSLFSLNLHSIFFFNNCTCWMCCHRGLCTLLQTNRKKTTTTEWICIDNVAKTNRSLFNSWRSGGAFIGTSSNSHINHFSEPLSFQSTTTTRIMATSSGILKDCTHISFNEAIKSQNNVTFRLVKTGMLIQMSFNL